VLTDFAIYRCTNLVGGAWSYLTGGIHRSASGTNTWWSAPPAGPYAVYYRPALPPTNQ